MAQANHYVQTGFIETDSALIDANTCSMLDHDPMNTVTDDKEDEIGSSRQDFNSQKSRDSHEGDESIQPDCSKSTTYRDDQVQ